MDNIIVAERREQFAEIVSMIQQTRDEVVRLANTSLIDLYWKIGKYISEKTLYPNGEMVLSHN